MQYPLYVLGAVFELGGIVLLASPDLVPGAKRLSCRLSVMWRRFENRVRRLLRLRPRSTVVGIAAAVEADVAASIAMVVKVGSDATLDKKAEFLLRQDQERQRDVNALRERVHTLERESLERLAEHASRMERYVAEAAAIYRPVRVIGSIALALGLGLVTAGNLV